MKLKIAQLLIFFIFAQTAFGQAAVRQKLQARLDEWHRSGKFAGATLGACTADGKCFALATGFSDLEAKKPIKPGDLMLAGSTGKTFALAVAMQLAAEGRIKLDEKIEKYLGAEKWFARLPNARSITVRQLMNHTSGLVRYEFKDQFLKPIPTKSGVRKSCSLIFSTRKPLSKPAKAGIIPTRITSCSA